MFKLLNDPKWVMKTPIVCVFLLEGANIQQLYQMWVVDHSADGQSLTAWLCVQAALWLWLNFYLVMVARKDAYFAIYGTSVGIALNMLVCLSVVYWRFYA